MRCKFDVLLYKCIKTSDNPPAYENLEHWPVLVIVHYKVIETGNNLIQISSFKFNWLGWLLKLVTSYCLVCLNDYGEQCLITGISAIVATFTDSLGKSPIQVNFTKQNFHYFFCFKLEFLFTKQFDTLHGKKL